MDCPKCPGSPLEEKQHAEGLLIDLCGVCGGAWADRGEVVGFVGRYTLLEKGLPVGEPSPTHHACPRCEKLMDRVALEGAGLEFEVCAPCGGTWFDGREVQALRAHLTRLAAPPARAPAPPRPAWRAAAPVALGLAATVGLWSFLKRTPPPPPPPPALAAAAAPADAPEPPPAPRARQPDAAAEAAAFLARRALDADPGVITTGSFPGPCAMVETTEGPEISAAAGEIVGVFGRFRERASFKVAMVGNGPVQPVEVVDWMTDRIAVRLPRWLRPGRYRLSVNCYYDGHTYTRGAQDLLITDRQPPQGEPQPIMDLPLQLSGEPAEMMGAGQAMAVLSRTRDAIRAFSAAAQGYRSRLDRAREVAARRQVIAAAESGGLHAEAQAERYRIAELYFDASRAAALPEEVRKMELAHGEIGFELARYALQKKDVREAERIYTAQRAVFKRYEVRLLEASALEGLGRVAAERGDHKAAVDRFKDALELYLAAGHAPGVEACERAAFESRRMLRSSP